MDPIPPVHRLPAELLSVIFIHCIPEGSLAPLPRDAPMLLTVVCSHWRRVALSTARLWSSIAVWLNMPTNAALLDTWLARSRKYPMSLTLLSEQYQGPVATEWIQRLTSIYPRVKHLSCRFLMAEYRLLSAMRGQLSSLSSLEIVPSHSEKSTVIPHIDDLFYSSPKLHDVTLPGQLLSLRTLLPWSQLTRITVKLSQNVDITFALTHMPNLSYCFLHNEPESRRSPSNAVLHNVVRHAKLETLIVIANEYAFYSVFERCTLPNLRNLTLGTQSYSPAPPASFLAFLKRSKCALRKLALTTPFYSTTTSACLAHCLDVLPTITKLKLTELDHPNQDCDTLEELEARTTVRDASGTAVVEHVLLPHLRILDVSCARLHDDFDGRFLRMLKSRWRKGGGSHGDGEQDGPASACLERVTLRFLAERPSAMLIEELKKMMHDGLRIVVTVRQVVVLP
ncbi:hypothetical protein PLICRDRAFT_702117 [Plicaturopsis crispa FD-325 SS-3]|uniref:F-box domain-containing protein n=1 Tax=Plicaturopsis crispa FD-325 SS-3 TaxID=944288 RepID=A0A0C9SX76_PLICR|nr:hypothetical protein PLICRDRAFT_702117 [Plicaturopsis crispa FD-325 SS-3]